jgi:hypothetical protein
LPTPTAGALALATAQLAQHGGDLLQGVEDLVDRVAEVRRLASDRRLLLRRGRLERIGRSGRTGRGRLRLLPAAQERQTDAGNLTGNVSETGELLKTAQKIERHGETPFIRRQFVEASLARSAPRCAYRVMFGLGPREVSRNLSSFYWELARAGRKAP